MAPFMPSLRGYPRVGLLGRSMDMPRFVYVYNTECLTSITRNRISIFFQTISLLVDGHCQRRSLPSLEVGMNTAESACRHDTRPFRCHFTPLKGASMFPQNPGTFEICNPGLSLSGLRSRRRTEEESGYVPTP